MCVCIYINIPYAPFHDEDVGRVQKERVGELVVLSRRQWATGDVLVLFVLLLSAAVGSCG